MTFFKKLGCAAALAMSVSAVQAAPILNDWVFNPNGGGYHKGQDIGEYLDVNGNAFIQLKADLANPGSFTFTEHAVFNLIQADSNGKLFPLNYNGGNISATMSVTGTGSFGGAFTFTGGTIRMYQNPTGGQYGSSAGIYGANLGNLIAEFNVLVGGGGRVDAKGSPISNGQVSVFAEAMPGMLAAGYFFDRQGNDLSRFKVDSFAFTNASTFSRPSRTLVSEVACGFAGYKGAGCGKGTYSNVAGDHFFVGANGQFKLASEVPEPGSVALFSLALFGVAAARRRRAR